MRRVGVLVVLAVALGFASPARAVVSCTFTDHVVFVSMNGGGESVKLIRNGQMILVNGAACGGATVESAASITVIGTNIDQTVAINLAGGAFVPGFGGESDVPEVEIGLSLNPTAKVQIYGSAGSDSITLARDGAYLNPDADIDVTLFGGTFSYLSGGAGPDFLRSDGLSRAGAPLGDPLAYGVIIDAGAGADIVYGGSGADTLAGGPGIDTVRGGAGDDLIVGNAFSGHADVYDGGPGRDKLDYASETGRVVVYGNMDANTPETTADRARNFEAYTLGQGGDSFVGYASATPIDGGAGNDEILIGIYAGGQPNTIRGGPGNDRLWGKDGGPAQEVPGDVFYGGPGNDWIAGTQRRDTIVGGPGDDRLYGDGAGDVFVMDATADGSDNVYGYAYEVSGDKAVDTVDYSARTNPLTIVLDGFSGDGEPGENDRIHTDIESVIGGSAGDRIVGSDAANRLQGRGGNDHLTGGKGKDILIGGTGSDLLDAIDGFVDYLYTGGSAGDYVHVDTIDVVSAYGP